MAAKAIGVEMARGMDKPPSAEEMLRDPATHARRLADLVSEGRVDRVENELTNIAAWLYPFPSRGVQYREALSILSGSVPPDLRPMLVPVKGTR
jgi:hypothetical protein